MANTGVTITLNLKDQATGGLHKFTGAVNGLQGAGAQAAGVMATTGQAATSAAAGTSRLAGSFATLAFMAKAFIASRVARAVTTLGRSIVQAAMTQEDAEAKLRASLLATGQLTEQNVAKFRELASARQLVTRYGDEATQSEIATAIAMGVSLDKIEPLTVAAQDFASTFRIDLSSAFRIASQAFMGNVEGLSRYGFRLDDTNIKRLHSMKLIGQQAEQQRDQLILQDKTNQGEAYFAKLRGQSNAEGATTAGSIAKLTNAWGDYKEELGKVITTSGGFASATRQLTGYLKQLKSNLEGGVSAGWISTVNEYFNSWAKLLHAATVKLEKFQRMADLSKAGTMESSTHYQA